MRDKYSRLQISIHWLVLLPVIVAYHAVEFRGFFPCSDRPLISVIHASCGILILILMVVCLLLRLKCSIPPIILKLKPMMTGLAYLGHLAIYLLFIVLPVIGLAMMYNRGNPQFALGLMMSYAPEANLERVNSLKSRYEALANLGYFVIGLHATAALVHHYFWKDNTPPRMMLRKRSRRIFEENVHTKTDPWYR